MAIVLVWRVILAVFGVIVLGHLFTGTQYYCMQEIEHLNDRIRFGRLEFHKKISVTLGNIEVHNREKIFTISFSGD